MAEVFLCPKGSIESATRRELKRAGVIVIESEQPERCQFIRSSELVSSSDMLWAALDALNYTPSYTSDGAKQRERLAKNLLDIVLKAREPIDPPRPQAPQE